MQHPGGAPTRPETAATIAVVGVSDDGTKYGTRVFRDLAARGYTVYPVHLKGGTIDSHVRYRTLADIPNVPELVVTVVPPAVTEDIVRQAYELGIRRVWMQPGSESDTAIAWCREHGMEVVHHACIILA